MELAYTYEKGDKFLVGYFDDYPEYPTQGDQEHSLPEDRLPFKKP